MDTEILRLLLLLEQVQEAFYGAALEQARLDGDLLRYAEIVGAQETEHAAFLAERLGGSTPSRPQSDFGDALTDPDRFRDAAIELEEATLSAYIGQGANLTRPVMAAIARTRLRRGPAGGLVARPRRGLARATGRGSGA